MLQWLYYTCGQTIQSHRSPVCTFSQPHTSWRRTVLWDRFFAPLWSRKRRRPGHQAAPPPFPPALSGTGSRGSTRPDVEPSERQREAAPAWRSSAHQAQGNPYPAPPTSPVNKRHEIERDILLRRDMYADKNYSNSDNTVVLNEHVCLTATCSTEWEDHILASW